jgi:Cu/Ag efflux protein CusF
MSPPRRLALAALAALALPACREPAPAAPAASPAAARYVVRAEVVRLPAAPGGELSLRHEAIDDFRDASGAVVGMDAMVMPFQVAPGVSLDGLAPGDPVRATLSVDFARPALSVVALEELPAGTALEFRRARRP